LRLSIFRPYAPPASSLHPAGAVEPLQFLPRFCSSFKVPLPELIVTDEFPDSLPSVPKSPCEVGVSREASRVDLPGPRPRAGCR